MRSIQAQELTFSDIGKLLVMEGDRGTSFRIPITWIAFAFRPRDNSDVTVEVTLNDVEVRYVFEPEQLVKIAELDTY